MFGYFERVIKTETPVGLQMPHRSAVGFNTVRKALKKGIAEAVFLASDADAHIKTEIQEKADTAKVAVNSEYTMAQLGEMCAIQVSCSVCCILKSGV